MASNPKKDLKSTLNQFLTMKGAPDNFRPWLKKNLSNKLSDDIKKISSDKYKKSDRAFSGVRSKFLL